MSSTILLIRNIPKKLMNQIRKLSTEPSILTKETGTAGIVILNRPKALNALSRQLTLELIDSLKKFETEKSLVIIKGAGDRSFCSGGDIIEAARAFQDEKIRKDSMKYILNLNELLYLIHTFKIPTIAFINGIAFGGGAGIGVFSKYSIATEKTMFAMPEVKFGFHPNSGGSYFFNKHNRFLGYYLALTGLVLKGTDVVNANYATHFCRSSNLNKLEEELVNCSNQSDVQSIVESICEKNLPESSLSPVIDKINRCFSEDTVENIMLKLKKDNSSWAKKTLDIIESYPPTCLKVILKQLQKGKDMDLVECLAMESNLTPNFYNYSDVFEGTKSILIDKTYKPKWNPAKLSEVTEELVESHFQSLNDVEQREILQRRHL